MLTAEPSLWAPPLNYVREKVKRKTKSSFEALPILSNIVGYKGRSSENKEMSVKFPVGAAITLGVCLKSPNYISNLLWMAANGVACMLRSCTRLRVQLKAFTERREGGKGREGKREKRKKAGRKEEERKEGGREGRQEGRKKGGKAGSRKNVQL